MSLKFPWFMESNCLLWKHEKVEYSQHMELQQCTVSPCLLYTSYLLWWLWANGMKNHSKCARAMDKMKYLAKVIINNITSGDYSQLYTEPITSHMALAHAAGCSLFSQKWSSTCGLAAPVCRLLAVTSFPSFLIQLSRCTEHDEKEHKYNKASDWKIP